MVDALGNVATYDLTTNGLPTVVIDRVNRVTQFAYSSVGNVTGVINPDLTTEAKTYNTFSEPLTSTNENNATTSFTYDSHGNNTVIEDALANLTTMTYTTTGRVQSITDANNHTTTIQYDSQDRTQQREPRRHHPQVRIQPATWPPPTSATSRLPSASTPLTA